MGSVKRKFEKAVYAGKRLSVALRPSLNEELNLVADRTLERMLGHKTVPACIAGPEIADEIVGQIGRSLRGYH